LLALLADCEWHTVDELHAITPYVNEWIAELRASGDVLEEHDGRVRIRAVG
jgi:hypothetical protein